MFYVLIMFVGVFKNLFNVRDIVPGAAVEIIFNLKKKKLSGVVGAGFFGDDFNSVALAKTMQNPSLAPALPCCTSPFRPIR